MSKQGEEEDVLHDGCAAADPEKQGHLWTVMDYNVFNISAKLQANSINILFAHSYLYRWGTEPAKD